MPVPWIIPRAGPARVSLGSKVFAARPGDIRPDAGYDGWFPERGNTMSRNALQLDGRTFYGYEEAAAYLRSKGLDDAGRSTIDHHYRRTKRLGEPKRAGRKVYWHRSQLDALIDAL